MDYLAVTALLMDRLTALGHGGQSVPGPAGTDWTASSLAAHARARALELAARFDGRNGTARVGTLVRERLDRRPLVDRLPPGVRAGRPAAPPGKSEAAPAPSPETPAKTPPNLTALLAEAHRLSDAQHPDAGAAAGLSDHDRACVEDHRAMYGSLPPAEAMAAFGRAAALYEAAGDPGEAAAATGRASYARALEPGGADGALAAVAPVVDRILALYADGAATARQASAALVCRARILARLVQDAPDEAAAESAVAGLEQGARELLAFTEPLRGEPGVATRTAEALDLLGDVAAFRGDPHGALERYERAAAETDGAGLSWYAVGSSTWPRRPGSPPNWRSTSGRKGRHGPRWSTEPRSSRRAGGPGCICGSPKSSPVPGSSPRRSSRGWTPRTGRTSRARAGRSGPMPAISSAAGCSGWTGRRRAADIARAGPSSTTTRCWRIRPRRRSTGPVSARRRSWRTHGPGSCGASWAMSRRWCGRCGCGPGSRSARGSRARLRRGRSWRRPSGSARTRWPPPRRTGRPGCSRSSRTPTVRPAS
ncbi:hypothetical protein [Streptomyces sp. NPDC056323]|uniref:hypothetical protein n=1 Tax=Streptomyces sp. NPDC056323 TaxID=3345784 RepID=UPI0035D6BE82